VSAGVEFQSLDALAEAEGWRTKFRSDVLSICTVNGRLIGVPVGLHRLNTFMYNKQVLAAANATLPTSWDTFITACQAVKASGKACLTMSNESWVQNIVMRGVLMMTFNDVERYRRFSNGSGDINDPLVDQAAANYLELINNYVDRAAINSTPSWSAAAGELYAGDAAFYMHGDWAVGYLKALGWDDADFGAIAVPGSQQLFVYGVDAFYLPQSSKEPAAALEVARAFGSVSAQTNFNRVKGSTSGRTDLNIADDPISAGTYADLQNATVVIPPSGDGLQENVFHRIMGTNDAGTITAPELADALRQAYYPSDGGM